MARRPLSIDEIVEGGLCIGCGLCQSIAGPERLTIVATADGRERPLATGPLPPATLSRINDVCPGIRVDAADPATLPAGVPTDEVWGPAARLVIGYASDPELRYRAASGGVLTALADFLLASGEVELILHVAASRDRPMRSVRHLSIDRAQLLEGTGSRYGPAAPLVDFCELLERGRPFAFIGKPCDVTAVRNLARHDSRVDICMRYALSLVCGGESALGKSQDVIAERRIEERDVTLFRYRGYGNPGPTRVETRSGAAHELTYTEMWGDEAGWKIQSRCKVCPDPLGDSADIVSADCWEDAVPTGEDDGFNAILARTARGVELFDAAVAAGALTITEEIGFRDLDRFQPHQLRKKRAMAARLAGMRAAGRPVPRARGLHLLSLARQNPLRVSLREGTGAFRRARAGRLGEPPADSGEPLLER